MTEGPEPVGLDPPQKPRWRRHLQTGFCCGPGHGKAKLRRKPVKTTARYLPTHPASKNLHLYVLKRATGHEKTSRRRREETWSGLASRYALLVQQQHQSIFPAAWRFRSIARNAVNTVTCFLFRPAVREEECRETLVPSYRLDSENQQKGGGVLGSKKGGRRLARW